MIRQVTQETADSTNGLGHMAAALAGSERRRFPAFARIRIDQAIIDLPALQEAVLRNHGRIELVRADGQSCVLITKSELDALEQAIEILSKTDSARAMQDGVARIIAAASAAHPSVD